MCCVINSLLSTSGSEDMRVQG